MTTETKLAVLRYLKKWYEPGYKILKNAFDDTGLRRRARHLAATMTETGKTEQEIAGEFDISIMTSKEWVREGQLYKLYDLQPSKHI